MIYDDAAIETTSVNTQPIIDPRIKPLQKSPANGLIAIHMESIPTTAETETRASRIVFNFLNCYRISKHHAAHINPIEARSIEPSSSILNYDMNQFNARKSMESLPRLELHVLQTFYQNGSATPTGLARNLQTDVGSVTRILSNLLDRGIVEKSERRLESRNPLQHGLVAYELTESGRRYTALTLGLMETLDPFPIGVKRVLQLAELRNHFRKLEKWIRDSLKRTEVGVRTGEVSYQRLAYSRQVLTVAETHLQDSFEKTLNVGKRRTDVLRRIGSHETSQQELELLLSGKVDIGLLTKTQAEKVLFRSEAFDLVLLDVIIGGAPTFLSVYPRKTTQYIAYPEGSTQRLELAVKLSKGVDPVPVGCQSELLGGQLDGTYGKTITPIEPLLRLELGGAKGPRYELEQSREAYLLVAKPSSLRNIYLRKFVRDLDRFHGILEDRGQIYNTVSNYVTGPMLTELNELLTKKYRPRIITGLEELRPSYAHP